MKSKQRRIFMPLVMSLLIALAGAFSLLRADVGTCGGVSINLPFTDVAGNAFFCQIAAAYFSGLTNGTSPSSYSPGNNVTREQMAAFTTRTLDQSLKRGSQRAALKQFSTPKSSHNLGLVQVGNNTNQTPSFAVESDGEDLWVGDIFSSTVTRVHASDGKPLGQWTGALNPYGIVVARGKVYVTGNTSPGKLYQIDPKAAPGAVTVGASNLGAQPRGAAYDGESVWTANFSGSVSRVAVTDPAPWPVTTESSNFSHPTGILYDGKNMWVTDGGDASLKKMEPEEALVMLTVPVGDNPQAPVFDGTNIWVPNYGSHSVTVVRAATGAVLATLTGNGLDNPVTAAFDGERILITNQGSNRVSLWKATDLSPLGWVGTPTDPYGACSDGLNFWIALNRGVLARF